jgi:hypothetical protein
MSSNYRCQIKKGKGFRMTLNDLSSLHRRLITKEITGGGDTNPLTKHMYPNPGEFRSKFVHLRSGFFIKKSWKIDKRLAELIKKYDLKDSKGDPLVKVQGLLIKVPRSNYYVGRAVYASSKVVLSEMKLLVKNINQYVNNYLKGIKSSISPLEFIADTQRRYVSIHPFHEGNGRMSRLLQDIFLDLFDLPFLLSAYLQEDVINNKANYRTKTFEVMNNTLNVLESCSRKLKAGKLAPKCIPLYTPLKKDPLVSVRESFFEKLNKSLKSINLKGMVECK